jgi:hypothetical protein
MMDHKEPVVLNWAWQGSRLTCRDDGNLDNAFESAVKAARNGDETFECIEVIDEGESTFYSLSDAQKYVEQWAEPALSEHETWAQVYVELPGRGFALVESSAGYVEAADDVKWWVEKLGDPDRVSTFTRHDAMVINNLDRLRKEQMGLAQDDEADTV